jgi:hypothetical protein
MPMLSGIIVKIFFQDTQSRHRLHITHNHSSLVTQVGLVLILVHLALINDYDFGMKAGYTFA